jgi:hypothetical protein
VWLKYHTIRLSDDWWRIAVSGQSSAVPIVRQ